MAVLGVCSFALAGLCAGKDAHATWRDGADFFGLGVSPTDQLSKAFKFPIGFNRSI